MHVGCIYPKSSGKNALVFVFPLLCLTCENSFRYQLFKLKLERQMPLRVRFMEAWLIPPECFEKIFFTTKYGFHAKKCATSILTDGNIIALRLENMTQD